MMVGSHPHAVTRDWLQKTLVAVTACWLGLLLPAVVTAQTSFCTDCALYAITELNLRQEPSLDAEVLRFVPAGAEVLRTSDPAVNGYAPVVYDSVPGWVVALGLVTSPEEIIADPTPTPPTLPDEHRLSLSALTLRSGPAINADAILIMPEGSLMTLTREGAENGYVTVDYDGTQGWAYADLLGEVDG